MLKNCLKYFRQEVIFINKTFKNMKKISLTIATIFLLSSTANAQDHSTHKEEMEDVAHGNATHKDNMKAVDHEKAAHSRMKAADHAYKAHPCTKKGVQAIADGVVLSSKISDIPLLAEGVAVKRPG